MKHRCELRFRSHWAFAHASLSPVPLCVSWAFLVDDALATAAAYFGTAAHTKQLIQMPEHLKSNLNCFRLEKPKMLGWAFSKKPRAFCNLDFCVDTD